MELTAELLLSFFDSSPDGILIVDKNCTVVAANDSYLEIFSEKRELLVGKNFEDIKKNSNLAKVIKTGVPMIDVEYKGRSGPRAKHSYKGLGLYISVFPMGYNGEIVGGAATYRALTDVRERILEFEKILKRYGNEIRTQNQAYYDLTKILGESESIHQIKGLVARVAKSEVPVLLRGESGTGKELFAQALHNASKRADEPFVAINCPSLTESLAESELFGYEEGSFSGALKGGKLGLFELAHNGTMFLDEIGDLSKNLQAKILRVLENGEFFRVGGINPIKVDFRLISATNRDLEDMIRQNQFREDLYFRLCIMTVDVPPLRERGRDVLLLAEHFLHIYSEEHKYLSKEVEQVFLNYDWPGNIRELKNAILTMVNFTEENNLQIQHLPQRIQKNRNALRDISTTTKPITRGLNSDAEIQALFAHLKGRKKEQAMQLHSMLEEYGYSVKAKKTIAQLNGICLTTLYARIKEYSLRQD